jgi:hypothetical protein
VYATWPGRDWAAEPPKSPGLKIFNLHPLLIALNESTLEGYSALKKALAAENKSLSNATHELVESYRNSGLGAHTFLERLLRQIRNEPVLTISQIVDRHLEDRH